MEARIPGFCALCRSRCGCISASYNNLIDAGAADPISGTMALRSYLCEVRRAP
jgi:hypothetical protein